MEAIDGATFRPQGHLMMSDTDLFLRLGASLAIGLLVGIERGWKARGLEDHGRAAGLRTFGLSGLMGGISAILAQEFGTAILAAVFLGFATALGAFAWLESKATGDLSATTLLAGLSTFLLGSMAAVGNVSVAVAGAVSMTVLLALRTQLHSWLFNLTWPEIRAGLVLLVMAFLLLPLLPDRAVDPFGAINPREIWILAIALAAISFAGYVAVKAFGGTWGVLLTAAVGGLASSTATTVSLARLGRAEPALANLISGGILIAGSVMMLRVWSLVVILNPALAAQFVPLGAGLLVLGGAGLGLFAANHYSSVRGQAAEILVRNPLELSTSLKLAALIALVMLAVDAIRLVWGEAGVIFLSAVSGLFDVDAITVSLAKMESGAGLAAAGILVATSINTLSKAVLAAWLGGAAVGLRVGLASLAATSAIGMAYAVCC